MLNMAKTWHDRLVWAMDNHQPPIKRPELAKAVGVSTATIAQWRNKETKNMKMRNLFRAANYLGVEAEWLALGTGDKQPSLLSNNEQKLIETYRAMDEDRQSEMQQYAKYQRTISFTGNDKARKEFQGKLKNSRSNQKLNK